MRWWTRMMMSPVEKALVNPAYYRAELDREAVLEHIDAGATHRDHETQAWMRRSATEINEKGPLTIEAVEISAQRSKDARDRPHDRAYDNFAILSAIGDDALLRFLVAHANKLATEIQPGAEKMLADAF